MRFGHLATERPFKMNNKLLNKLLSDEYKKKLIFLTSKKN